MKKDEEKLMKKYTKRNGNINFFIETNSKDTKLSPKVVIINFKA